jgi:CheY-like chemotaxis protein
MSHLSILFIEDDQIETLKFQQIVKAVHEKHQVTIAENGVVAIKKLEQVTTLPNLILLDLNMPKMNGIEFLKILKSNPSYKFIPVVILSTSNYPNDILQCYDLGIAGYIMKPLKYNDYKLCVENLINYWSHNEFVTK